MKKEAAAGQRERFDVVNCLPTVPHIQINDGHEDRSLHS